MAKSRKIEVEGKEVTIIFDKEKDATRQQAINEWKKLKRLDIEKDYRSWKQHSKK